MKRRISLLISLVKKLNHELEKSSDLFLSEREFLTNPHKNTQITLNHNLRAENNRRISAIIKEIQRL